MARLPRIVTLIIVVGAALMMLRPSWRDQLQHQTAPYRDQGLAGAPIDSPSMPGAKKPLPAGVSREQLEAPAPSPHQLEGYAPLTFDLLAGYDFDGRSVPPRITEFHERQVAVSGFMVPLTTDLEGVVDFILVKNQLLCCYGQTPKMNEWIYVLMEGDSRTQARLDQPITVAGRLLVGADEKDGQLLSLYRMVADEVVPMESSY